MPEVTRFPTTNSDPLNGGFTNPENMGADDGAYATAAPAKNQSIANRFGGFDFDSQIPAGATITKVEVVYEYKVSTQASIANAGAVAYVGGVAEETHADSSEPLSDTIITVDITADRTWTRDDLLDANFKVQMVGGRGNSSTAVTFSYDYTSVRVTYTIPDTPINAEPGSYGKTGAAATLLLGLVLAAGALAGSYGLVGSDATTLVGRVGQADPGTYAAAGAPATTLVGRLGVADAGAYAVTGADATTVYGSPNVVLAADPGVYAVTGTPATTQADRAATADPGTYAVTGAPAGTTWGHVTLADPGAYALVGAPAGTTRALVSVADAGSYAVVGPDADLAAGGIVVLPDYPVLVVVADQRVLVDLDDGLPVHVLPDSAGVTVTLAKRT